MSKVITFKFWKLKFLNGSILDKKLELKDKVSNFGKFELGKGDMSLISLLYKNNFLSSGKAHWEKGEISTILLLLKERYSRVLHFNDFRFVISFTLMKLFNKSRFCKLLDRIRSKQWRK